MKIYLNSGRVKKEWTDYNGHMNLAFYIHLFDAGWEVLLQKFNTVSYTHLTLPTIYSV